MELWPADSIIIITSFKLNRKARTSQKQEIYELNEWMNAWYYLIQIHIQTRVVVKRLNDQ